MSRNRVRRAFTVETKARGRQAPAILPVRAPLLEQASPAFPSLEAAALFGGAPARPDEERAEPTGRSAPRRILPSLIEAPAPEPEVIETVAQEPRLPRVRRVKAPRAAVAQGETVQDAGVSAKRPRAPRPASPVIDLAGPEQARPVQGKPTSVALSPVAVKAAAAKVAEPGRRAARRPEKALPLGARWKRRLPRVCW